MSDAAGNDSNQRLMGTPDRIRRAWPSAAVALAVLLIGISVSDAQAQCDSGSCPLGCCFGSKCVTPTASQCGYAGSACIDCGLSADTCVTGQCQCGGGPSCGAGQECVGGVCACTPGACPTGCCDGAGQCQTPTASQCGTAGAACVDCGSLADACAAGVCQCGSGPACTEGQACSGGVCSCTAVSCPAGCCDGSSCATPTPSQCGTAGGACLDCGIEADSCVSGVCQCGSGPMCVVGESCVGGSCVVPVPIPALSRWTWWTLGALGAGAAVWLGARNRARR